MGEGSVSEIFKFSEKETFIENLHVLPNGKILLSTFESEFSGDLLILDPGATPPSCKSLVTLPGSNGLTGIAHLDGNRYAVTGGVHLPFKFKNDTMALYVVEIDAENERGVVLETIPVPDTEMLNGMDSIPQSPHIILSVDSIRGRIFRINTHTKEVDITFADRSLEPTNNGVPLGANGLKIKGDHLYFTNSAEGTFSSVQIDKFGNRIGFVHTIASLQDVSMAGNLYDDFDISSKGEAFLSVHHASVNRITKDGAQSILAGGFDGTLVRDPTSVALANDENSVYVGTGGGGSGGQVLNIVL